ncbi:MAG TPA: ABC transporter ATP-binding protein [Flavobacterium sp.]|jgi:iron complex transport system ATP-binding protein
MEKPAILHTEDLCIGYRNKKQVRIICANINLNLRRGSLITLVGANGIGKSTLLRTLSGIMPPIEGKVSLDDSDMQQYDSLTLAKKLSVVLTDALPPSNLTVFELVALGRQPYTNWLGTLTTDDVAKVNSALELVQATELANRRHFEISDGQLQKALIARALAQDSPFIILDEPTTHLDLQHKVALFRLLKKLTRETGKTILFSTHDLDLAMNVSDEMIVMTKNNLVQGSPSTLANNRIFDSIFDDNSIVFDAASGKFIFKDL